MGVTQSKNEASTNNHTKRQKVTWHGKTGADSVCPTKISPLSQNKGRRRGGNNLKTFHQFSYLGEDIAVVILSYLSEAPFEVKDTVKSPLTHVLPLVNQQFYEICKLDTIWLASLQRLTYRNPDLCKDAFKKLFNAGKTNPKWSVFYREAIDKDGFMLANKVHNMDYFDKEEIYQLVSNIYDAVSCHDTTDKTPPSSSSQRHGQSLLPSNSIDSARSMYFTVLKDVAYITLPVFHMRCPTVQREMYMNLTLFEPRYRMLVREAMEGRKAFEFQGRLLTEPRPRFLFAHTRNLENGCSAFLVEIQRCRMLEGGRARIMIQPIKKVKLDSIFPRPNVHNGLHDARIKRFGNNPQ
mmetsp:Transcript_11031/g.20615  ORF Transcript_11031/g.20615 Transcript_11031/m.20615 type:complete len:352 (+) Transcript_11031:150-1205(+)